MEGNGVATKSEEEQFAVWNQVFRIYDLVFGLPPHAQALHFEIRRDNHVEYLTRGLSQMGPGFSVMDATRPWVCYWVMHSIALLGDCVSDKLENDIIDFLQRCQDPNGGYGGGPGQMPHLATTYAAINTLITVGGIRSLTSINRETLYGFLLRMKDSGGGFRMHDGGEIDVRACYTAISVASILNILDHRLIQGTGDYIMRCQTYEGGIAGEPGSEAHGGYTFCGLAAMVLMNEVNRLDLPQLINWIVFRQGVEGGFQGRTNKLVDGCYSFWQGAAIAIIQRLRSTVMEQLGLPLSKTDFSQEGAADSSNSDQEEHSEPESSVNDICQSEVAGVDHNGDSFIKALQEIGPLFNTFGLQQYILLCTQEEAGFRDKPGKSRDHYHTCYVLSGLSICHYAGTRNIDRPPRTQDIMGPYSNLLEPVHPLYNVVFDKYQEAFRFFSSLNHDHFRGLYS